MKERGNPLLRFADRNVGIPVVRCLGVVQRRRRQPERIQSMGLLKDAGIGDVILMSGVVQDLRREYPHARLTMFAGAGTAAPAWLIPGLDEVVELGLTSPLACLRTLRRYRLDVLIDFGQWSRINALLCAGSGARHRIGFRTAGQFRHYGYDALADHLATRHELDNFRALTAMLGVAGRALPTIAAVPVADAAVTGPYGVFHAWPSGRMSHVKEWPADRWRELAQRLRAERLKIVLTGSPDDRERSARLAAAIGPSADVVDLAGRIAFSALPGLLSAAEVVVSVNTGIMHLAAAVGAPTVALNGPTSALRWGPVGARTRSVSVDPPRGGYLNLGFEYEGHPLDSMSYIDVDAVWSAVRDVRAAAPHLVRQAKMTTLGQRGGRR
jgi:ADP-heptose:LPS heptosyltransferase